MPISFTPISVTDCWCGSTWTINDEDILSDMLARVAMGQSRTVENILHATDALQPGYPTGVFVGARALLTVGEGQDPYHRDGWVFQVISWIAAHIQDNNALIRAPQMIKAHKGFDGLFIEFEDDDVARVVISEEKATENARQQIRSAVWPEFREFETGARDNELVASVTSLLERFADPDPDLDKIVADILWQETRAYRVAITVGEGHSSDAGRKRLFKDYEKNVSGNVARRRAETLLLDDVRDWIASIATKAIAIVNAAEDNSHV